MTAWKDLERRICNALGGRRAGPLGASVSDCVNTPFSVEVKRSSRLGPPVLSQWITQARTNGRRENRPWLCVVAGHNDRRPIVCLDFWEFVQIAQQAGRIGASVPRDRVRSSTRPGGPRRSTTGTATLKGANLRTETETVEPVAEPEPPDEPEPDEPDTDDDDDDAE